MSIQDQQGTSPDTQQASQPDKNAILISRNVLAALKSAVRNKANPIDKLPSDRDLVDFVLREMINTQATPIYFKGTLSSEAYKWFDSDEAKYIQSNPGIVDKRRYVEAMIGAYLYGWDWARTYCVASKLIRPRALTAEQKVQYRNTAAEIADAKSTESTFCPTTAKFDQTELE